MADISDALWSELDASNTATAPNGFPEGMPPASVNDSDRAVMGAIKRWYNTIQPTRTSTGSANAQILTFTQAHTAYVYGDTYSFFAGFTNLGPMTIDIDGLGPVAVITESAAPLTGGEVHANYPVEIVYDGTSFRLIGRLQQSLASPGFTVLPGGMVLQAGSVSFSITNTAAVSFPYTFSTLVLGVFTEIEQGPGGTLTTGIANVTGTGFDFNLNAIASTTGRWFAIGY